jgi:Fe-S oxidoreductase
MAGSFGYDKEHYQVSMTCGEDRLFPAVRAAAPETIIVAAGISCRHQITKGTGRQVVHPILCWPRRWLSYQGPSKKKSPCPVLHPAHYCL